MTKVKKNPQLRMCLDLLQHVLKWHPLHQFFLGNVKQSLLNELFGCDRGRPSNPVCGNHVETNHVQERSKLVLPVSITHRDDVVPTPRESSSVEEG